MLSNSSCECWGGGVDTDWVRVPELMALDVAWWHRGNHRTIILCMASIFNNKLKKKKRLWFLLCDVMISSHLLFVRGQLQNHAELCAPKAAGTIVTWVSDLQAQALKTPVQGWQEAWPSAHSRPAACHWIARFPLDTLKKWQCIVWIKSLKRQKTQLQSPKRAGKFN